LRVEKEQTLYLLLGVAEKLSAISHSNSHVQSKHLSKCRDVLLVQKKYLDNHIACLLQMCQVLSSTAALVVPASAAQNWILDMTREARHR
jgi:hypothetical protein